MLARNRFVGGLRALVLGSLLLASASAQTPQPGSSAHPSTAAPSATQTPTVAGNSLPSNTPASAQPAVTSLEYAKTLAAMLGGKLSPAQGVRPITGLPAPNKNWPNKYQVRHAATKPAPGKPQFVQPPLFPLANANEDYEEYKEIDAAGRITQTIVCYAINGSPAPTITLYGPRSAPDPITGQVTKAGDTYDVTARFIGTSVVIFAKQPPTMPVRPAAVPEMLSMVQTALSDPAKSKKGVTGAFLQTQTSTRLDNGNYSVVTQTQLVVTGPNGVPMATPSLTPPNCKTYDGEGNMLSR